MLNDINGNLASSLLNGSLSSQNVSNITNSLKNAYGANAQSTDLVDGGVISDEALAKYQADQEIAYYTKILNDMFEEDSQPVGDVASLIQQIKEGNYSIDDSTLADSILADEDAKNLLNY